ncbi:unknown similar to AMEV075 [Choristoneura rosaceana entomopoxvirus 'L']|uniref:Uncharacterized protein n=1 Tax=Choristoneura rosaceana entomopoxvirus 'L' TaxID=1293539 RepID=A0ABM9QKJ6_9POXV|nr:unknown similar to AMEV075 [Choristoneura rosaceana entomopoxvirus 'L']CCU56063.1 unknown similar to AMEV075 [Choristoneura rosaceana entomopoxvirus 'L']
MSEHKYITQIHNFIKMLKKYDIILFDDEDIDLSNIMIAKEYIIDNYKYLLSTNTIKDIIIIGLLSKIYNVEIDLRDQLLAYHGICVNCDHEYESKNDNKILISDLFCKDCGEELFDVDPLEI